MKLLIVDDEELTRTGVISSIDWQSIGIQEVLQADDGINGIEMARVHRPDIVLCDVRMPRLDGIAMLEQLEEILPDIVPVFMSGYSDKEYLKAAIKLKAVNYIEKPLNPVEIRDAIVEARAVLGKTRDPQRSDMILDQAYFQEMEQLAKDSGSQFLLGYVQMLVDAANLRSVVRVLRMGRDADFLATVLFPGGAIPAATVVKAADGEPLESIYFSSLFEEAAAAGVQAIQGGSLTAFEKACDNALNAYMQKAKYIPFGEQPMLGYVSAKDNEFTAIRIILTGRLADLPADVIRERLRNAYV